MSKFTSLVSKFVREDEGAALIEYSILIALISVAVVATIGLISPKLKDYWTDLNAALPAVTP